MRERPSRRFAVTARRRDRQDGAILSAAACHTVPHRAPHRAPNRARSSWFSLVTAATAVLLLVSGACARTAVTAPGGGGGTPTLTGKPLGDTFVAVDGTGFPAQTPAVVTGTTPHGSSTVNVTTDGAGDLTTSIPVPQGYQGPLTLRAAVGSAVGTATVNAGTASGAVAADAGVQSPPDVKCTVTADVGSVPTVRAGDVVCLTGNLDSSRLAITTGGSPGSPIVYTGGGASTVQGIDVTTDNVVVEGFTSRDGASNGAKLLGNNIVFQDNTINHPVYAGDDTDGIRFYGSGVAIIHNTIKHVYNGSHCDANGCGNSPHPDCMQTFYSHQYPTSSNITIEGNYCTDIAAQCLIAEGSVVPAENVNGPGESADWIFFDNYCDDGAAQAVQLKDIKNATIVGNDFEGSNNKAIALSDASTGAHVGGNKLNSQIGKLITFDDGLEAPGYLGPQPDQ
jgi:Right handed beta helix region